MVFRLHGEGARISFTTARDGLSLKVGRFCIMMLGVNNPAPPYSGGNLQAELMVYG
jgi:hypothetical protein